MGKSKSMPKEEIARTTLAIPKSLWKRVRVRAIEEETDATTLVARALEEYLKRKEKS